MSEPTHEIRVPVELLGANLTRLEQMVYIAIRSCQGANEWTWASQRHIAGLLGTSRARISKAVSRLNDRGWIERDGKNMRCLVPELTRTDLTTKRADPATNVTNPARADPATSVAQTATERADPATGCADSASPSENQQLKPTPKTNTERESTALSEKDAMDPNLKHPAVGIYRSVIKLTPNEEQRKLIARSVDPGSTPQLDAWKGELKRTLQHGWRKQNVAGILTRTSEALVAENEKPLTLPDELKPSENGRTHSQRKSATDEDEIAETLAIGNAVLGIEP